MGRIDLVPRQLWLSCSCWCTSLCLRTPHAEKRVGRKKSWDLYLVVQWPTITSGRHNIIERNLSILNGISVSDFEIAHLTYFVGHPQDFFYGRSSSRLFGVFSSFLHWVNLASKVLINNQSILNLNRLVIKTKCLREQWHDLFNLRHKIFLSYLISNH